MKRTLLRFENVQQVVGGDGMAVIILTDGERKRALSVFRGPVSGYADE